MPTSYEKVTKIEDLLPDLEQVDPISQAQPMVNKQKGIRTTDQMGNIPRESGMSYYHQPAPDIYKTEDPYGGDYDLFFDEDLAKDYRPKKTNHSNIFEPYEKTQHSPKDCNCRYIYDHVKECDICKRFYKPDVTPYLVIILILIIACAMMAKKLFNF